MTSVLHNGGPVQSEKSKNGSEKLADTPFTVQWFLDTIRTKSKKYGKLLQGKDDISVNAIEIGEDKGMMSKIYKVDVLPANDTKPMFSTILKIPGTDAFLNSRQTPEDVDQNESYKDLRKSVFAFHERECDYFANVSHIVDSFPVPEAIDFDASKDGINFILLEFVGNSRSDETFETLTINQLKKFVRLLAKFHREALLNESAWRGKYEMVTLDRKAMTDIREKNFEECRELLKEKNLHDLDEGLKKLEPIFKSYDVYEYILKKSHHEKGIPSILCHGDAWSNNLLWETNSDDSLSDNLLAVLDWQWLNEGNPAQDIAKLLAISASTKIRKEAEEFLCEYYYEELTRLLKEVDRKPPYTLEQFKRAYWLAFIAHMAVYVVLLPKLAISGDKQEKSNVEHYVRKAKFFLDDALRVVAEEFPQYVVSE
jgi:thiamine kinase-like enzyme